MDFSKHELLFSKSRRARYISACRGDIDKGLDLYTQRPDFAENPSLIFKDSYGKEHLDLFFRHKLETAESKLIYKGYPVNHAKMVSELTFGFWVKFFDTGPIKILKGAPLQAFTNKPRVKLGKVYSHLNSIVALRNRISHSEPICFDRTGKICLDTMRQHQFNIEDALRWLDTDLSQMGRKI